MKYYHFNQNNSGGSFVINKEQGIAHEVYVQANSSGEANIIAINKGIYFNGCSDGSDCPCCGDRWDPVCEDDAKTSLPDFNSAEYWSGWYRDTAAVYKDDGSVKWYEQPKE